MVFWALCWCLCVAVTECLKLTSHSSVVASSKTRPGASVLCGNRPRTCGSSEPCGCHIELEAVRNTCWLYPCLATKGPREVTGFSSSLSLQPPVSGSVGLAEAPEMGGLISILALPPTSEAGQLLEFWDGSGDREDG